MELPSEDILATLARYSTCTFDKKSWKVICSMQANDSRDNERNYYYYTNYLPVLFKMHPSITQIIVLPICESLQEKYQICVTVLYIGTV